MKISKLSKMKMPADSHKFDMSDMQDDSAPSDDDSEGSPDEEASESPAEEKAEGDDQGEMHHDLSECSDEDLLAEIKKRGLMDQLSKSPADDQSSGGDSGSDSGKYSDMGM